jgi:hypothetical protein
MVDGQSVREFWAHWQHDPDLTQEFIRFRTRMLEVADAIWDDYFLRFESRRKRYAVVSGTAYSNYTIFGSSGLSKSLKEAKNVFEVAMATQYLLWTIETEANFGLADCCRKLQGAFELSPTIMIRLVQNGKNATLYPTGARILDEDLVESNLIWLARYPQALKPFEDALKIYMAKDPNQYRSMLDNLRFSVEQMLRIVLNNQKSLENQKEEFLRWLAKHGAHSQIVGMYSDLLARFAKYQNDAVKHDEDEYTPAEVEFVLYATGTFLRFIQRASEQ